MTENEHRIFLCHTKEDKPLVKKLYHQLKAAGYHPWLDEEDILPGADWELEIRRAIRDSALFLACLSQKSMNRKGYVHKEIKMGLDELDQMPEGRIYLIPVRLEECQVPDRLQSRQWVDLFAPRGFEQLKRALDSEIARCVVQSNPGRVTLNPDRLPFEPEMLLIPAGDFLMGSEPSKDRDAQDAEQPQHTVYLPGYYMARTPVTNAQYSVFVQATGHEKPEHWNHAKPPEGKDEHPVVWVTWHDAVDYCNWLAETSGEPYRLPGEAEWEKGARGTGGCIWPWGDEWGAKRCNCREGGPDETTPVGAYPDGVSPYGLLDMAGNVLEWSDSIPTPYPYEPANGRDYPKAVDARIVRGGAFGNSRSGVRCAIRFRVSPSGKSLDIGFRVCVAAQWD